MVNKLEIRESASGCPMHDIQLASDKVRKESHDIFGKPSLKLDNNLGGVEGKHLIDFLTDLYNNDLNTLREDDLIDMQNLSIIGVNSTSDMKDATIMLRYKHEVYYMSKLMSKIYTDFIQSFKLHASNRRKFYHLSKEFFQAFDAVLLTGANISETHQDFMDMKGIMKKIIINLTQIPTNIQEPLTKPGFVLNYKFKNNEPYLLSRMKEIFDSGKYDFQSLYKWIQNERGGYGVCPAAEDGTLMKAFDILFDIYGELIVTPKEEKLLQST